VLDGVILLWFVLTALSVAFVAIDIRSTPESPVLKWGFILVAAYTGPFGAFLYVLGCREPLPGLHERYVTARWRQVLGSTSHCVAGDGIGILAGAAIGSTFHLSPPTHLALEYVLGFGFGWTIFQSLFMRDMVGGSYSRSLRHTFIPELLSMNALMAGMVPVMTILMSHIFDSDSPRSPRFWFVMSMALFSGALVGYPMNWWLVVNHLKHGMMTVRKPDSMQPIRPDTTPAMNQEMGGKMAMPGMGMSGMEMAETGKSGMGMSEAPSTLRPSAASIAAMTVLSVAVFGAGILASRWLQFSPPGRN
jgi:hypothetical protein